MKPINSNKLVNVIDTEMNKDLAICEQNGGKKRHKLEEIGFRILIKHITEFFPQSYQTSFYSTTFKWEYFSSPTSCPFSSPRLP